MTVTYGVNVSVGESIGGVPLSVASEIPMIFGAFPADKGASPDTIGRSETITEVTSWENFKSLYGGEETWGSTMTRANEWNAYKTVKHLLTVAQITPIIIYNALDPDTHQTAVTDEVLTFAADDLDQPLANKFVQHSTIVVTDNPMTTTWVRDTDYTVTRDSSGVTQITRLATGGIGATDDILVDYDYCVPTQITDNEATTAIAEVDNVLTVLGPSKLPGWLHAPGWSQKNQTLIQVANVRAQLNTKATLFSSIFTTRFVYDLDRTTYAGSGTLSDLTDDKTVSSAYGRAFAGDGTYGTVTEQLLSDWFLGEQAYVVDVNGFPGVSPSYQRNLVSYTPTDKWSISDANTIRDLGITTTFLDMGGSGGYRLWGTWTSYYNGTSTDYSLDEAVQNDVNTYLSRVLILDTWSKYADGALTRPKIEKIVEQWDSLGRSLKGQGKLLGFRILFLEQDNPDLTTEVNFRIQLLAPPTMKRTDFIVQADLNYLNNVFPS